MQIFVEISLLLLLTVIISIIARLLKQPLVVGYILAGIIAGPYFLNVLKSEHEIELFSKVGIVLLLFIVGLHLNPKVVKEVGKVSIMGGIGQIAVTTLIGFFIALILGMGKIAALYISIALTFSSTIIILKLISDKRDLQKLYAKIAIGFLIIQDIVATLILVGVAVFTQNSSTPIAMTLGITILKGGLLFGILLGMNGFVLPRLTQIISTSQELLFLFSLAWGLSLASIFYLIGFSVEIGALVAGVTLSTTHYAEEISARMKPLRDFFVVLFFILLGSQMALNDLGNLILPAIILSLFVLIGNPVIVIILMNVLGFSRRTSFLTGLTVAQISEFSLILAALGFQVGHISQEVLSLITLVGLITIAGSTYLIMYSEQLYSSIAHLLQFLELVKTKPIDKDKNKCNYSLALLGYDRVGVDFVKAFKKLDKDFFVVDYNPKSITHLKNLEIPCFYGDAADVEFLDALPLDNVKLCVSTIPETSANLLLIKHLKKLQPKTIVVVLAHTLDDAKNLYKHGASYVIMPHFLGAQHAARLIKRLGIDHAQFTKEREKHLEIIDKRFALAI